jgi:hypothetical protein
MADRGCLPRGSAAGPAPDACGSVVAEGLDGVRGLAAGPGSRAQGVTTRHPSDQPGHPEGGGEAGLAWRQIGELLLLAFVPPLDDRAGQLTGRSS